MKTNLNGMSIILSLLISVTINAQNGTTQTSELLNPTGPYKIGTMTYEWTDDSRDLKLTNHSEDKRTLVAQLWYPSEIDSNSVKAKLNAISEDYSFVTTNSFLRTKFNQEIRDAHVIFISPGRGTERFLYTTMSEELASHGFVVVAVDMPEIGYTIYGDGFVVKPSAKFKPPGGMMGGPYEKVDTFFENPTQIGFEDLQFVYGRLKELNANDPNNRFTSKFNLDEIGIFGHSLGGRIAGKFAAETKAVKGYMAMEGIPPREIRYKGLLKIPVAMLCSSGTWPYAKDNYNSLINNRTHPVYMIELPDFGHNSVTDNPYIYPQSFNYGIDPKKGLIITRKIALNYFKAVLNESVSFDKQLKEISEILVTYHEKKQ